jgi:ribosomal protein S18 acetylase RimI-like enzyme
MMSLVAMSQIDEERFGIRTARCSNIKLADLPHVIDFCMTNGVKLLIARCLTSDLETAQALEREGFFLTDVLVYYSRDLLKTPIPEDICDVKVRPFIPGDEKAIKIIAERAFQGYMGHYHADPRLDRKKCDEVYVSWAERSCLYREVADQVFVAVDGEKILGFNAVRMKNHEESEWILVGVDPSAQRRGIYRSLLINAMLWSLSKGAKCMIASTQVQNIAAQKVWVRLGFEPLLSYYTFHKWFD